MGREKDRLSDKAVKAKKKRGRYSDSGGLYLHITKLGYKSWEYRFSIRGKLRTMGLGSYPRVSLKEARIKRDDARKLRDNNIDPIIARGQRRQIAAASLTVDQAAEAYVAVMEKEWKTKRYASQIRARLETYVKPVIGHLPIADIGLAEIKQVLVPIWTNKRPTANRIRKHLEGAINWAIAEGHRTDESNPAEVKRLQFSLSFAERKVTHYPSLPYSEAPSFLAELRKQDGVKARALEFVMLTAVRVADICGGGKEHAVPMLWQHVDMPSQSWTIPDTKTGKPHVVPLSDPAVMLLGEMQAARDPTTDFVFPGAKRGTVINAATLRVLLQDMGFAGVATTHGFRATFRTWASETTAFDKDVIETCLAHAQGELDSAYHRGSYLDKRRRLMSAWADYCDGRTIMQGAEAKRLVPPVIHPGGARITIDTYWAPTMTSPHTSASFLLGRSQTILGDAWRSKMFRKMPKPPGDGLTARVVAELREELAIKWFAAKPDLKTVKRDDYKPECIRKFRITGRGYQSRVWPAARKLAGLEHARPGPKKQIRK